MKKPSENQWWILFRMADRGWTISPGPLSAALSDGHSARKNIPQKTLRVLKEENWIEQDPANAALYRITDRGRRAVGHTKAPGAAGGTR